MGPGQPRNVIVCRFPRRGSAMMELICRASHLNPSALEIAKKNPSLIKGVKTFQTRRSKRNQR